MRKICVIAVSAVIVVVSMIMALVNPWLALALFLALAGSFVGNGLKKVPAKPPHKAVLMFFGKRQEETLDEGWNFFPLYPFFFSFVLVKVEKVNTEFASQKVRTPDRAEISVSASITWKPGIQGKQGSYIAYLNSGGEEGVIGILGDTIEDRIKTWATSNKEGPSSWMEAQGMRDDIHAVLAKSLLGDALEPVNSPIPTSAWTRFLDTPQSEPTEYDANPRNGWASKNPTTGDWNWGGLQAIFDGYSPEVRAELKRRIEHRKTDVRKLREGKGDFGDESLGITILRFSVNEVRVEGEVAKAAEQEEKERRERAADTMEIDNISDRAKKLLADHPGLTSEQAFKLVQVERGKATRTTIDVTGANTALGSDLLGLAGVAKEIMAGLKGGGSSGGGQGNRGGEGSGGGSGSGGKKGGGQPAKSTKELAQEFADANSGQYPRWDPLKRQPQYNG